jgi:TP901 family phage tail tape measure protein
MAQINLKVLTDIKQSKEQLDTLKGVVQSVSKSLSSVTVNKDLTAQLNALTRNYNALVKAAEKVQKINYNNEIQEERLAQARSKTAKAHAEEIAAMEKSNTQYAKHQKAVNDEIRSQEKHAAQMKKSTEQTRKKTKATKESTEANKEHSQSLATMIPNILRWQVAMTAVMLPLRKLREALDSINETLVETEKRVIALQRVAGQAANANELYDLAQKYGQTFENVSEVVELLVKSGYEWEESIQAAEAALIAMNVAELDATQATEGLISVIKQYGMDLSDLNYIQGVLNKTADNAAVTTEKLLLALQKTGSTADNANISFEETVGLITALSEGTAASGQNIGNALRSLIIFTKDEKALKTFASLSSDMTEVVKQYKTGGASIVSVWKQLGVEIQRLEKDGNTLRDVFGGTNIDSDIETKLVELEDQIAEVYGTAGNYRQNYFISLLKNLETVDTVTNNLNDANTYSQKENLEYLQTYEAKVTALDAKWKQLANNEQGFLSFKKGLVDAGVYLLEFVDTIGGLRTVMIAVGGAAIAAFGPTLLKSIKDIAAALKGATTAATTFQSTMGWITLAVTSISIIVGIVEKVNRDKIEQISESLSKAANNLESLSTKIEDSEEEYKEYIEQVLKLRNVLDDSTTSEKEKKTAQEQLMTIQNSLIESNKNYANSIDFINGKLEEQIGVFEELRYQRQRDAIEQFYKENVDSYSNLDSYFNTEYDEIVFSEKGSFWDHFAFSELESWLMNQGYSPTTTNTNTDLNIDLLTSFFGNKTENTILDLKDGSTIEDVLSTLLYLEEQAIATNASEYVRGQIREQINAIIESEDYKNAILLRDGSKDSSVFAETLTADQVRQIANGTMSDEEFKKLVDDFYKSKYPSEPDEGPDEGAEGDNISKPTDKTTEIQLLESEIRLLEAQGASEDEIKNKKREIAALMLEQIDYMESIGSTQAEINNFTAEYYDLLSEIGDDSLSKILSKMKEIRDVSKEEMETEKKKKEFAEAEEALRKAQENRTSKIFNAATGQWEWRENTQDVLSAQEKLDKLRDEYEMETMDKIIDYVESGAGDLTTISNIIKNAEALSGGYFYRIRSAFASSIYKPVSIEQSSTEKFSNDAAKFGLLYGSSRNPAQSPIVPNTSNVNNSSQTTIYINGVPITVSDAQNYSVSDLIRNFGIVNN